MLQHSVNVLKTLPLSNDLIQRRIDEMSSDVERQLDEKFKTSKFSIQLDKSTVRGSYSYVVCSFYR